MKFANVILPLSLKGTFTYHIPEELQDQVLLGQRVVVPFGGKKLYTAIIIEFHDRDPELYKTKSIYCILEDFSMVTPLQLKYWKWICEYYLCSLGEVYQNVFPSALRVESETFIRKTSQEINWEELEEKEVFIMQSLETKTSVSLKEIEAFLSKKYIISTVKALYDKNLIELDEQIIEKYKPKKISYLRLNSVFKDGEIFKKALIEIAKAPKQREALLNFVQLEQRRAGYIEKKELVNLSSQAIVKALVTKEYIEEFELEKDRIEDYDDNVEDNLLLSVAQQQTLDQIKINFGKYNTVLLEGVTGSGKTEIYFRLIEEYLKEANCCLFLLPEISITVQLVKKIQKRFGNEVGMYHSKLNPNEKAEIWKNTLFGKYKILIGSRSALFLPMQNLGLIIVDEEHDSSYKQQEFPPYYQARDCVQILAAQTGAKVILGSATPSMESLYNCQLGKFAKVELKERYGNIQLPQVEMVSLKKPTVSANISYKLQEQIQETLLNKKQVILFHNRRGYAPILECNQCGYSPGCPNCDVSLTYHKTNSALHCHYCGYRQALPQLCPNCHSISLTTKGLGTQQIEEEIKYLFPNARVERMDVDTMRKKHAYEILFEKMAAREIDILIGTQMITKGLDFNHVQLVGVIRADSLLNLPYFRAEEKAIQLLIQVSGRAGRRKKGKVLIQTFDVENPYYLFVKEHNYDLAKTAILQHRKEFRYPPYYRLIELTFKHKNREKAKKTADYIGDFLKNYIQESCILGPEEAQIFRMNNNYYYKILIKNPSDKSTRNLKKYIQESLSRLQFVKALSSVKIEVNVDP